MSTLKPSKNVVWMPKMIIRKNAFRKGMFSRRLSLHVPTFGPFAHFGSETDFLMKFLDDSAWFCLEKLKKRVVSTKNFEILQPIQQILQKSKK